MVWCVRQSPHGFKSRREMFAAAATSIVLVDRDALMRGSGSIREISVANAGLKRWP
jgi:hypothetical protein